LRGPLARRARDALLAGAVAECGYFEPAVLDRLLQQHAAGRRDHSATLWSLLMLDAFLRRMQQPVGAGASHSASGALAATALS
jgi:asparagine synthase (glutamine-hydrolysing)